MRAALTSAAVIAAAGAMIGAGGAFSVFNDAGASNGSFARGTVKLAVTGQQPATDIFALAGPCTSRYQDALSPTDAQNLGTVNNTGCTSTFTVHNAGSLPMELSGTTLTDSNPVDPVKLACFTSTIPASDTSQTAPLLPGTDRLVHVRTITSSDDKNCQGLTDKVTVNLIATETTRYLTVAVGPGQNISNRRLNADQAVTTTFQRVRLVGKGETVAAYGVSATCATALCIDTSDLTYSTSVGASYFGPTMTYAWAAGCNSPDGKANVNLTGTPYAVAPNAFQVSSYGSITYSQNNQVVDLTANGSCGDTRSKTFPLLPLAAAS